MLTTTDRISFLPYGKLGGGVGDPETKSDKYLSPELDSNKDET